MKRLLCCWEDGDCSANLTQWWTVATSLLNWMKMDEESGWRNTLRQGYWISEATKLYESLKSETSRQLNHVDGCLNGTNQAVCAVSLKERMSPSPEVLKKSQNALTTPVAVAKYLGLWRDLIKAFAKFETVCKLPTQDWLQVFTFTTDQVGS